MGAPGADRSSPYGAGPNGNEALPAGWEQAQDPGSGKTYFFNRASGQTTWDRPSGVSAAAAPAVAPTAAPAAAGPGGNEALPAGWEQAQDPSGKTYFFNRASGQTTWD